MRDECDAEGEGESEGACQFDTDVAIQCEGAWENWLWREATCTNDKLGVIVKYLLSGLTANNNAPTSSLAYDRRPARVPVRFRIYSLRLATVWGSLGSGLEIRVRARVRVGHQISEGRASPAQSVSYFGPRYT